MMASEAVAERLAGDAGFAGMLSLHDGAPACFAHGLVPPGVGLPFCVVDDPSIDKPADTKTTQGRDITLRVRFYSGPGLGAEATELAEAARAVLHRSPVDVEPYTAWATDAGGPTAVADRSLTGRAIQVRIRTTTA